jgi:hypothetical protein
LQKKPSKRLQYRKKELSLQMLFGICENLAYALVKSSLVFVLVEGRRLSALKFVRTCTVLALQAIRGRAETANDAESVAFQ